ncbi:MAG: tetratricopeptide repeat protein [Roseiflexaceae bacterium]
MPSLPTGTITFLFTDIVGSTRLWEQHPTATRAALAQHDALIEACVAQYHGTVVRPRGEGDSRFAVFVYATDAVAAAVAIQQQLARAIWPTPAPIQVRMALHTGATELRDGDYYGSDVNRCARLRAAGHGGQILLSQATAALAREHLPAGVELRDLGSHRLKDLTQPEQITQIVVAGARSDFSPLNTLDRRPTNLPVQPNPLIGRERDIAAACALLLRPDLRLVTMIGPGGTGKTRLSLHVAAELTDAFADGVFFVSLAAVDSPAMLTTAVAHALGVRESGDRSLLDNLTDFLRARRILLLLDNFEHLIDAAPQAALVLAQCPHLKVLVTSREALRVSGEQLFPVAPLGLPGPSDLQAADDALADVLATFPAVALVVARARAGMPDFALTPRNAAAVAAICARLDGLPLAIELAATRTRLFAPPALLARLVNRLRELRGGARDVPARQQTLRAAIDWSYQLLTESEQMLFRRLGVFVGGWTLEAAEAVGQNLALDVVDGIESLAQKSLLREQSDQDEPRFFMLETIREYALEQLAAHGEAAEVQQHHSAHFLELVERAEPELTGADQELWVKRLDRDNDNLRAALDWALEREDGTIAARLCGALWRFWDMRGYISEGRQRLEGALSRNTMIATPVRAKVFLGAGVFSYRQSDYTQAQAHYQAAQALLMELNDRQLLAYVFICLGVIANEQGHNIQAQSLYEHSLAIYRELGDLRGVALTLSNLGVIAGDRGEHDLSEAFYSESLSIRRLLGDRWSIATSLNNLGMIGFYRREYRRAKALFEESLHIGRDLKNEWLIAHVVSNLGFIAYFEADVSNALMCFGESLVILRELGDLRGIAECLEGFGLTAAGQARLQRAAYLYSAAAALRQEVGAPLSDIDADMHQEPLALLRSKLASTAFAVAWEDGRTLPLAQTIMFALADADVLPREA